MVRKMLTRPLLLCVLALSLALLLCIGTAVAEEVAEEAKEVDYAEMMRQELENEYMESQAKKQQLPDFKKMRAKRLKELLKERGESCEDCVEKEELIEKLRKVYHKPVLEEFKQEEMDWGEDTRIEDLPEAILELLPPSKAKAVKESFDASDPANRAMIKTALLLGNMENLNKCSACEATLIELQLDMQEKLFRKAGEGKKHRWARIWNLFDKAKKKELIESSLDDKLCAVMDHYGLHEASNWFVPAGSELEGDINTNSTNTKNLHMICDFILETLKESVVDKLADDELRIKKLITEKGLDLAENLMQVWATARADACEELMYTTACKDNLHPQADKAQKFSENNSGKMDWDELSDGVSKRRQGKEDAYKEKMEKKEARKKSREL
mmetsp:Transcript_4793/g.5584  ORF Transcript_4793/g.5584 Transcript_4793/m.5584 type:complete len:385 (+) Transcript_4793:92-1246(+)|eukprot:CAMPEP_0197850520 /NCGR_PEP_ID=MMETSP1438-20131217/15598_1 /TAXON_ID=1461541 /ORGANISM="Pterosperma sp., Strain CCMP1384" /LENGTH=384 /DNA_ID=CAMNT_0043463723 /DNA_START=92 /DNA_END=1246 /DNA_ORIENTATION=+